MPGHPQSPRRVDLIEPKRFPNHLRPLPLGSSNPCVYGLCSLHPRIIQSWKFWASLVHLENASFFVPKEPHSSFPGESHRALKNAFGRALLPPAPAVEYWAVVAAHIHNVKKVGRLEPHWKRVICT